MEMSHNTLGIICTNLVDQCLPDVDLTTLRQISRDCKFAIDSAIVALRPRDFFRPQLGELVKRFRNVRSLEVRHHGQVSDEELKGRLEQLKALKRLNSLKVVWDCGCRELPSFQGIGGLTSLFTLHYEYAEALTDKDLQALSSLVGLQELSLRGARRVSGTGLAVLKSHSHLRSLEVAECGGFTIDGLLVLEGLTQLTALNARYMGIYSDSKCPSMRSGTRMRKHTDILGILSSLTGLQKLDLAHAFTPHQEVLDQLTSLTRLTALYLGHGCGGERSQPAMEGSALLGLRELRALGVEGWHIYFGRGAACQLTSGSCNAAELALTELHASTWQHEHHEVLLSTALRKGTLKVLELHGPFDTASNRDDNIPHIPAWSQSTMLTRLHFHKCNVHSPEELRTLSLLKSLTFDMCTLYRVALKHLISSKMPLETLQFVLSGFCFDRTQTTEESNLETVVGNLSSLLRLRLPDGVILTQRCIDQLAWLTNLQKLDMYSHKRDDDVDICPLSALTQLTSLGMPNEQTTNLDLASIRNLKRLRSLNLDGGCFDDTGLSGLSELTMLSSLSLTGCDNITDDGLKAVVVPLSRHSLAWVDVHWCRRLTLFSSAESMGVVGCNIINLKPPDLMLQAMFGFMDCDLAPEAEL